MTEKKTIKEFVKEHKAAIEIGCYVVATGVALFAGYKILTGPKWNVGWQFKTEKEADECLNAVTTAITAWEDMGHGTGAHTWDTADAVALGEKFVDGIWTDVNGETMKVTGAILFGNKVET